MNVLMLSDEALTIIHAGLMELQAKFSLPVILDIERQLKETADVSAA